MIVKLKGRSDPVRVEYFDDVRRRLLDVPWQQRQHLLTELVNRLDNLPGGVDPNSILGESEHYARLMRESAGYGPTPPRRFAYIRAWRLRRKLLTGATIVLVPTLIFAAAFAAHYQPLAAYALGGSSTAPIVESDRAIAESSAPIGVVFRRYEPGSEVVVTTEIHNRGHATATVTGVSIPNGFQPIVATGLRRAADAQSIGLPDRGVPVRTVAIGPGGTSYIFVMMKMQQETLGAGDSAWQANPTLNVDVLGVHHQVPIQGGGIGVIAQP